MSLFVEETVARGVGVVRGVREVRVKTADKEEMREATPLAALAVAAAKAEPVAMPGQVVTRTVSTFTSRMLLMPSQSTPRSSLEAAFEVAVGKAGPAGPADWVESREPGPMDNDQSVEPKVRLASRAQMDLTMVPRAT